MTAFLQLRSCSVGARTACFVLLTLLVLSGCQTGPRPDLADLYPQGVFPHESVESADNFSMAVIYPIRIEEEEYSSLEEETYRATGGRSAEAPVDNSGSGGNSDATEEGSAVASGDAQDGRDTQLKQAYGRETNGGQRVGDLRVMGYVERVVIHPEGLKLEAKLDTGATTSSLSARDISRFERDGRDWVRFSTLDPETGEDIVFERQLSRIVRIRRHLGEDTQERPVVKLQVELGGIRHEREFSLIDRSNFEFPVLIGRNYLRDLILVDSAERFLNDGGPSR